MGGAGRRSPETGDAVFHKGLPPGPRAVREDGVREPRTPSTSNDGYQFA
ncbi:hypothetical protein [Streptomyces sp. NPDC051098]